jgi:hypothetical protein
LIVYSPRSNPSEGDARDLDHRGKARRLDERAIDRIYVKFTQAGAELFA